MHDVIMPQLSKRKLDKKIEVKIVENLELILAKLGQKKEIGDFLFSLLTPTERLMLAKRLTIILLLKEGVKQENISQALKVTQSTVSRMQLVSSARGQGFDLAFKKFIHEQNVQDVKETLLKLASYSIRAAGGRVKPKIL